MGNVTGFQITSLSKGMHKAEEHTSPLPKYDAFGKLPNHLLKKKKEKNGGKKKSQSIPATD